jgi:ABC-type bacteriocin/lantibiotic exporter with double-glycine peptidase domain
MFHIFKRIYFHLDYKRRFQFIILFFLMIFGAICEISTLGAVLPFLSILTSPDQIFEIDFLKEIINSFQITNSNDLLLPISLIFSITVVISGLMRLILLWFQTRLCYSVGADLSFSIYKRTLFQKYSVHISRNSSEVISGISNKSNSIIYAALIPIISTLTSSLILIMMLGALIYINPQITLLSVFGFVIIYLVIISFSKKRLAYYSELSSEKSNQVVKAIQEGLGGIRDVLIDGTQNTYCDIYKNADVPLRRAQANIIIIGGSPRYGVEALGILLMVLLAYSLASRDGGIGTAVPILGAFAMGAQRMLPILQLIYSNWTTIKSNEIFLKDTLDLLDQPLPEYSSVSFRNSMPFTDNISFNLVSFRYSASAPYVLKNINIEINKGEVIGFMGTTGSGKSTLLDILMGLIAPSSGELKIDGVEINEHNCRAWQTHIAHVPQAIFLSDTTIAENIAFGVPFDKIDMQRVKEVSQKAQIAELIENMDQKYLTFVGERGIRLSGGQRQRIGIARALYKKADVIVFDEATSALDNETEKEVMNSIYQLGNVGELTIFIVAHRLTTLKNCNKIFELSRGKILRTGSYQELVQNSLS